MPVAFEVMNPGFQTTVQDFGRTGYRHLGVPVAGGLDKQAVSIANRLAGNEPGAPCLESALFGPELRFLGDCIVALTGADMKPSLAGIPVPMWQSFRCTAGDVLKLGYRSSGCRSYIAFSGGIDVPEVLGSFSTFLTAGFGGFNGRTLKKGDILKTRFKEVKSDNLYRKYPEQYRPEYGARVNIKVIRGINADCFSLPDYEKLFKEPFTVNSRSNRMGCFLDSSIKIVSKFEAGSESFPAAPGSIQVLPNGQPVVLLNDAQSTGGYPQIGCVISADLGKLGQMVPGDRIIFEETGLNEAVLLAEEQLKAEGLVETYTNLKLYESSGTNRYEILLQYPEK